jgi:uncharacterized protein (DUF2235 family)
VQGRLYGVLDRSDPGQQVDYYHAGIGTMSAAGALTSATRTLTRWAGSLAGYGLLGIVANAYEFIVDHYRPGDGVYLVGFSRGAFAVRLVGGLLHRSGVLRPGAQNLIPYALELYERHDTHIAHAMAHLTRYEGILMLRAVWGEQAIDYQLVDSPGSDTSIGSGAQSWAPRRGGSGATEGKDG